MPPGIGYGRDALDKLLVEKYGIPEGDIPALRSALAAGEVTGGKYIEGEALEGVGQMAQRQMVELGAIPQLAEAKQSGTLSEPQFKDLADYYESVLEKSRAGVRDQARGLTQKAADEESELQFRRDRESAARRSQEIENRARVTRETVGGETDRLANMAEWLDGVKPTPGGGYSQQMQPAPGFTAVLPGKSDVIPVKQPQAPLPSFNRVETEFPVPAPDPYTERLERARAARQALLGK